MYRRTRQKTATAIKFEIEGASRPFTFLDIAMNTDRLFQSRDAIRVPLAMHITPNPDPQTPPSPAPVPGPSPITDPSPVEIPEPMEIPPVTPPPISDPPVTTPMG
jgi:hypothetical protein